MTVSEASKVIRTSKHSVYKFIQAGQLRAYDINGLKIDEESLKDFMTSRTLKIETARKEGK